jgi:hypothetical protein
MTGAFPACGETWSQINWPHVEQQVRRLQMRIAKAIQQERYIRAAATPYDSAFIAYFEQRNKRTLLLHQGW